MNESAQRVARTHPMVKQPSPYDEGGVHFPPNALPRTHVPTVIVCRDCGSELEPGETLDEHRAESGCGDGERPFAPARADDSWESLAAWYSGYAFCEHYRKVTLAQCKEAERGKAAARGEKVSEARLDDLAHIHPMYLDYLATHLGGRMQWEREYRAAGGLT